MGQSITINAALARAAEKLQQTGIESARLDSVVLLAHALGITREQIVFGLDNELDSKALLVFDALVARREKNEPIAYITGEKEFWSLDFYVTRDTLIPRPDSETLVEAALKQAQSHSNMWMSAQKQAKSITILDIGTGTGCLLIALLSELPEARGIGVDISERALQVASANAKRHGMDSRTQFVQSHWCDALDGTFDLIISNPPYITKSAMATLMPDVLHYEPATALVAGIDGLDAYRALAPQVAARLNPKGAVVFEVGQGQAELVAEIMSAQGLEIQAIEKDLAGIARCVVAIKN